MSDIYIPITEYTPDFGKGDGCHLRFDKLIGAEDYDPDVHYRGIIVEKCAESINWDYYVRIVGTDELLYVDIEDMRLKVLDISDLDNL